MCFLLRRKLSWGDCKQTLKPCAYSDLPPCCFQWTFSEETHWHMLLVRALTAAALLDFGLPRDKVRRLPLLSHFNSNPYLSSSLSVLPDLVQWRLPLREESWWKYMAIPCPSSDWHHPLRFYFCSLSGGPCLSMCFLLSLGFCLPLFFSLMFPKGFADVCTSFLGVPLLHPLHTPVTKVYAVVSTHQNGARTSSVLTDMCTRFCTLGLNFSTT